MKSKTLASRLLYLPLWVGDKVELWLTYKGIKPGSLLSLIREKGMTQVHIKRIKKWLTDAGIHFQDDLGSKSGNHLIISKDKKVIDQIANLKFSFESHEEDFYQLGVLLGYPPKAARAYASGNRELLITPNDKDSPVKGNYETPYAQFMIRSGHEKEDIKIAKIWADTIRHDIPKLARWYEDEALTPLKQNTQTINCLGKH